MDRRIKDLYKEFDKIKQKGWIKSLSVGDNGVGITFENLLGISKNELEIPDYNGIELKAKRYNSQSYITLFSCKPEGKYYHEVERIKDQYGYPHKFLKKYKVLNNSVFCNFKNKIGNKFYFQLEIDRKNEKIYLLIYDLDNKLLEREVYWDFDTLKEKLDRKMRFLALAKAYSKKSDIDKTEYFKYYQLKVYYIKGFDKFINLIENGTIRINFKLNIRTHGEKIGQIHDHGTSFDILEKNISKLYNQIFI